MTENIWAILLAWPLKNSKLFETPFFMASVLLCCCCSVATVLAWWWWSTFFDDSMVLLFVIAAWCWWFGNIRCRTKLNPLAALWQFDLKRSIPNALMAREKPNTCELIYALRTANVRPSFRSEYSTISSTFWK